MSGHMWVMTLSWYVDSLPTCCDIGRALEVTSFIQLPVLRRVDMICDIQLLFVVRQVELILRRKTFVSGIGGYDLSYKPLVSE